VRVHISAKWSDLNITAVKCRSFHRRAPPVLPVMYDLWRWWVMVYTHRTTDRTINLLISSNVHYVYLGGDRKHYYSGNHNATKTEKNKRTHRKKTWWKRICRKQVSSKDGERRKRQHETELNGKKASGLRSDKARPLGGAAVRRRAHDREVMGSASGRIAIKWLQIGWVTAGGQVNHAGI